MGLLQCHRVYARSCLALLLSGMLALTFAFTLSPHPLRGGSAPAAPVPASVDPARIPAAIQPMLNASRAADDPAYTVTALPDTPTTLREANPAHRLTTAFTPDGIAFAGEHGARWQLHLAAIGEDAALPVVAPIATGKRIEYRRGDLTEWYVNGPLGIEQGFTLAAPPVSGASFILVQETGDDTTLALNGGEMTLALPDGQTLRYGNLHVTDATGRELPARLGIAGNTFAIAADLAGAVYPVTVDPLVTLEVTASDGGSSDFFGASVAMSADGKTMIVGAYGANGNQGAAYVYSGTNFVTEKKLTASDGGPNDHFGTSVAMSADGKTVIVGTTGTSGNRGTAYVYSGANYATEKILTASDGGANDYFGTSVAMSASGATVIVGANNNAAVRGAVYVYSGANYATEKKLTASDSVSGDTFGYSVAMNGSGATVIVGAIGKTVGVNTGQGAAYVYSGANYATEKKLIASDGGASDGFGKSVGISASGAAVIVGAFQKMVGANGNQGEAYIYNGPNYATEKKLTASDGAGSDFFGAAVAMSGDGTAAIVGAFYKQNDANLFQGAAYVYNGTNYATEKKLLPSDGAANDNFGNAVALSADGTAAIVGALTKTVGANSTQGAVYTGGTPAALPSSKFSPPPQSGPPAAAPPPKPNGSLGGSPNPLPPPRP
jgi:hypothetical protein